MLTPHRAAQLCAQGRATMIGDALRFVERVEITRQQRERNDQHATADFDKTTKENCTGRVWRTVHSGGGRMPGGPQLGVRQFVEVPEMRKPEKTS